MESGLSRQQLLADSLYNLRNLCQRIGIPKVGNKPAIVDRILKHFSSAESRKLAQKDPCLSEQFGSSCISLSNLQCFCSKFSSNVLLCTQCKKTQHRECIGDNAKIDPYICAGCQLVMQNPLEEVRKELIKPFFVAVASSTLPIRFLINSDIDPKRFELQLRCVRIDEIGFVSNWPKWGAVSINGRNVYEIKSPSNPNAKKRKDAPLDIAPMINKGENSLSISKYSDNDSYVAGLYLIEKKTDDQLIQQFLAASHISCSESIEMSKDYAVLQKLGTEDEVRSESIKLSLRCPYSKMLLKHPVRGNGCDHPQCFSLEPFILMQKVSKVNRWKCPVCKKLALNLVIDDFFEDVMQKAEGLADPEFVEIFRNGRYRIVDFDGNPSAAKQSLPADIFKRQRIDEEIKTPVKRVKLDKNYNLENSTASSTECAPTGSLDYPIDLD